MKLDVLILARPDHSVKIYNTLEQQSSTKFLYVSYKLLNRRWVWLGLKRVTYVGGNYVNLLWFTIRHILKYNCNKFVHFKEKEVFEKSAQPLLWKYRPRIIHYWPSYCHDIVKDYKSANDSTILVAEQYMPNPIVVMTIMAPIYKQYGIDVQNTYLARYSKSILRHFEGADYILVPSKFVEETIKYTFPDKKCICLSYGITKSKYYQQREKKNSVKNFVYVGGISLEKGCDLILKYFKDHSNLDLFLYGNITSTQIHIFECYFNEPNIHFMGSVSKEELQHALLSMDVGIHPSRFDAYSLAVAEEIGTGLPVIVSTNTGNADDVIGNEWGYVFQTDDINSLNNCVNRICDIENYQKLINSVDKSVNAPGPSYGEKVVNLYNDLLK